MILADTSVWIDFFKGKADIAEIFKDFLEAREILGASFIFGELLQGVKNKYEKEIILSYWQIIPKRDETDIWINAGSFSNEHHLLAKGVGLIDAAIITMSKQSKSKIWTFDKKLSGILSKEEIFVL